MQTQWNQLETWQRVTLARQLGCAPLKRVACPWILPAALVVIVAVITALLAAGVRADPPAQLSSGFPSQNKKKTDYISICTNWHPNYFRRKMRINNPPKTPGGSVGIRVEGSNQCPVLLMTSINGGAWRFVCLVTNDFTMDFPVTNRMQLFRLEEITTE